MNVGAIGGYAPMAVPAQILPSLYTCKSILLVCRMCAWQYTFDFRACVLSVEVTGNTYISNRTVLSFGLPLYFTILCLVGVLSVELTYDVHP